MKIVHIGRRSVRMGGVYRAMLDDGDRYVLVVGSNASRIVCYPVTLTLDNAVGLEVDVAQLSEIEAGSSDD